MAGQVNWLLGDVTPQSDWSQLGRRLASNRTMTALLLEFEPGPALLTVRDHMLASSTRLLMEEREHVRGIAAAWEQLSKSDQGPANSVDRLLYISRAWDMRLGLERDAIPLSEDLLPLTTQQIIAALAVEMGLLHGLPRRPPSGDDFVVMGGLAGSMQARVGALPGVLPPGLVLGLACRRIVGVRERWPAWLSRRAPRTEGELLWLTLANRYGLEAERSRVRRDTDGTRVVAHEDANVYVVEVTGPNGRSTTASSLRWLAQSKFASLVESAKFVTTEPFGTALRLALARDANGTAPVFAAPAASPLQAQHLLQEVKVVVDLVASPRHMAR